jgi:p-hydroxybenzoate 3-monooxygenase
VVIVGAGPAGLLPFHPPHLPGIGSVVLESRDRPYTQSLRTERRQRAGRLEQGTADVLRDSEVAERLDRKGLPHHVL